MYRNPSAVQRMMRSEEQLREDAENADRVEETLRRDYEKKVKEIDQTLEQVDKYFPTWQERVKQLTSNGGVKSALSTVKRKIVARWS